MRKYSKPEIATNPLAKNIAKLLGYYQYGASAFKVKLEDIADKIEKDSYKKISSQTILSWIIPKKEEIDKSQRNPQGDNLKIFANILGIDNQYELYIDPERWFDMKGLNDTQKKIIWQISQISNEKILGAIKTLCGTKLPDDPDQGLS